MNMQCALFEVHALDYLLKPIDADRFAESYGTGSSAIEASDNRLDRNTITQLADRVWSGQPAAGPVNATIYRSRWPKDKFCTRR